ncbi:MAG: manganese efflux pump [Bacillota bacterium]
MQGAFAGMLTSALPSAYNGVIIREVDCAMVIAALVFSMSLDNVVIGMAYGLKRIRITLLQNLIIAVITSLGTLISMLIGKTIAQLLPLEAMNYIGPGILILLGLYFGVLSVVQKHVPPDDQNVSAKNIDTMTQYAEKSDRDQSGSIDSREAALVALGLTLNNIGAGIAASIMSLSIVLTVVSTFAMSVVFLQIGLYLGNGIFSRMLGKYAPMISASIIIALGIYEMLA